MMSRPQEGCLAQVINEFFLSQAKGFKSGDLITHDFKVGKLFD